MKFKLAYGLLLAGFIFLQCSDDNSVEPTPSSSQIQGTINFTGEWPAAAEDVRVVVGEEFPIQAFDDLTMSDKINDGGDVTYSVDVENGEYQFVGVAWKAANGEWSLASICGVHSTEADFMAPTPVTVSSENPTATGINISVNRSQSRVYTGSQIVGRVDLQGAWPDTYSSAMLISSSKDLISDTFSLLDLNMGTAIERGETGADYVIPTPSGTIRTIGVAFLDSQGRLMQDAVYFAQNNGGLEVEEQSIGEDQTVSGPDFAVKLGSITSGIQGTVSFLGNWPAEAAEVRLITATEFPPAIEELIIGEEISPTATNHKYTFYLEPDVYKVVGVVWRAAETEWDLMSICGAYFAGEDSLAPSEVTIPDADTIVKDINIVVNRSKARKVTDTYIEGKVTFNGTWPSQFTEARVIATTKFRIFPPILPTMLDLAFSDPIPAGSTEIDYKMRAFPGTFAAIGVIFLKGEEQLTIDDILYSLDVDGLNLEPFEVAENTTVSNQNFDIRF
mgnify:CR=1 FL=1